MERVDAYTWRVPSNRRAGIVYTVKQDRWGDWSCGCKGFSFNHSCSHLLKVLEVVDSPQGRAERLALDPTSGTGFMPWLHIRWKVSRSMRCASLSAMVRSICCPICGEVASYLDHWLTW